MYSDDVRAAITPPERRFFKKLSTPQKIQDYLDRLPINHEVRGETYMSPRRVLQARTAHCFEGALVAACALACHDQTPLLLDLRTINGDDDHVVALFKQNGLWGAISKTNHPVLRYRDPVYRSPREIALSFFHEYFNDRGIKTLRTFSSPFDLSRYPAKKWVTAGEDLDWLVTALDKSRHFPIVPKKTEPLLRRAGPLELRATDAVEWKRTRRLAKGRQI